MSEAIPPSGEVPPNQPGKPAPESSSEEPGTDCFGPPREACECYCLHCQRVFMSDGIWFQKIINGGDGELDGFWMCPTPNCSGAGFTFDIFPTDPAHPANEGWSYEDDDEEAYFDEDGEETDAPEYDPSEPKYVALDEHYGQDDDDLEGEEWKHGLAPGERPPDPPWVAEARRHYEEEQKQYDGPDLRPRELDYSDRPRRPQRPPGPPRPPGEDGEINESDIPF